MNYRRIGRSGLVISEISLGSWLTYGGSLDEGRARKCIQRAYELGINYFDTADSYGDAERVLGAALEELPRSDYLVGTKCYFALGDRPTNRGLSRKHITESLNRSLAALGVEYVDILFCHRFDRETPIDETLRAMDDLSRQGKILYWGVSRWSAAQVVEAVLLARQNGAVAPICMQTVYNMTQRAVEVEVLETCEHFGLGVIAYSPLAQGILTGKYREGRTPAESRAADPGGRQAMYTFNPELVGKAQRLEEIATDAGYRLAQLALAWCLRKPVVCSALTGATQPEQLEENVQASGMQMNRELLDRLERVLQNAPVDPYTGRPISS